MKRVKLLPILACLMTLAPQTFAAEMFDVQDRIKSKKYYRSTYKTIFGKPEFGLMGDFKELVHSLPKKEKKAILSFVKDVDSFIPNKVLRPLVYWKFIAKDQKKVAEVLTFHMLNKAFILRDHIDNPLTSKIAKGQAKVYLEKVNLSSVASSQNVMSVLYPDYKDKAKRISKIKSLDSFVRALKETKVISENFQEKVPGLPNYTLSYMGIIPGNQVDVISENKVSMDRIQWLNDNVIFHGGKLDFNAPHIKMPTKEDPTGHPIFKEDPIYIKIADMITEAKDSIFIDIFLFGGTLGATLTEYLIDQTLEKRKTNPNFKTLLLHDYATNYNMKDEMMPIFHYIKKRIDTEPEVKKSVFLMQANIDRHPPGIPFGLTELIPRNDDTIAALQNRNTYYESKIDHSKVIVIDANTDKPQAYFGSKNWTDHSGGYYYDDAIWVKGPAAALVQASYYDDIEAALTTDPEELKYAFFFQKEGFDNKKYLPKRDEILEWFKVKKKNYPLLGKEAVRIAEADVDGTVKNVRNILVDMIKNANKNIYMEQLFLYDSYVVSALIKKKIQNPEIDIKVLMDHNGNFGLNGLPNTLFMKEMIKNGIEIKARKTVGVTAHFPNGHEQEYHQENHRKITSVDGKTLLGGSSNINPDTLQGSFREFGAQIYDTKSISRFEKRFLKAWNDHEETMVMDIENFQATVGGKTLSREASALINGLGSTIYKAKDKLERRY